MTFRRFLPAAAGVAALAAAALTLNAPLRHAVAQGVIVPLQNGFATAPSLFGVGDTLSGFYFGTNRAGVAGHLESGLKTANNAPALSTCGTGSLTAGSTDTAGDVTATGATACTLTFGTAFAASPSCVATDYTTAAGLKVLPSTGVSITVSGLTSGDRFSYICVAKSGG